MGIEEFVFERLQGLFIQVELDLEGPVRHTLALTQEVHDLIEDGVEVHPIPFTHERYA